MPTPPPPHAYPSRRPGERESRATGAGKRWRWRPGGILTLLMGFAGAGVQAAEPWALVGIVTRVSDGDTLTLVDAQQRAHRVRLAGVDAPERTQSFGRVSSRALGSALADRVVSADCLLQDRFGRSVCTVWLDGHDVGLGLLRAGLAWHFLEHVADQTPLEAARYARAEAEARGAGRGLWSQAGPVAPWDWRRQQLLVRKNAGRQGGGADLSVAPATPDPATP